MFKDLFDKPGTVAQFVSFKPNARNLGGLFQVTSLASIAEASQRGRTPKIAALPGVVVAGMYMYPAKPKTKFPKPEM